MANSLFGIIKVKWSQPPVRELLAVPHNYGKLVVSHPAFGPAGYKGNIKDMGANYSDPETGEVITFRPATTSESISAAAYDFENLAKPGIFDPRWLQIGYIVRTKEGVFTNTTQTDESKLKELLNGAQKVNGIYLIDDNTAFAPYESFNRGVQDCDTFEKGGLARALEHTSEKLAKNLRKIASFYKIGVNVICFDSANKPVLRVAGLSSDAGFLGEGSLGEGRLVVDGEGWGGGCAFGVLDKLRSDAPKN